MPTILERIEALEKKAKEETEKDETEGKKDSEDEVATLKNALKELCSILSQELGIDTGFVTNKL